jgi:membrane protein implicated in regulation of membrane protease activity
MFLIFLLLALVGAVFLIVSMFLGHDGDVSAEAEVEGGGPGFFSFRTFAIFLTTFGAVGAVASRYMKVESALISSTLGIMGGLIMSLVYFLAIRMVYSQQASSLISDRDLVGVEGRVTVAIPESGVGEVSCTLGGQSMRRMARVSGPQAIPEGAIVRVKAVHGDIIIVEPMS